MFDCFVAGVWPPALYPLSKGALLYDCDSTAEEAASKKKDYICKGRTTTLLRGPSLSLMHVLTEQDLFLQRSTQTESPIVHNLKVSVDEYSKLFDINISCYLM